MSRLWFRAGILMVALSAPRADGQQFWEKKPYQKWSKAETEKMLRDSPWAQRVTVSQVRMNQAGISTGPLGVTGVGAAADNAEAQHEQLIQLTYTAQLRSAAPMRQAVVRRRQLQEGYDSMPAESKAALDAKTEAYLARPQGEIVVYVSYDSPIRGYLDLGRRYWTQQTHDLLRNQVVLTLAGERVAPSGYAATDVAFQFNFPRPQSIPAEGLASLEFVHPAIGALPQERILLHFNLKKMLVNGVPAL